MGAVTSRNYIGKYTRTLKSKNKRLPFFLIDFE